MRKYFSLIILALTLSTLGAHAAEPMKVQCIEGELNLGISAPFKEIKDHSNCAGFDIGAELRYNLPRVPVAIGAMFELYNPERTTKGDYAGPADDYSGVLYGLTGEYNFRRGRDVNPFVGLGAGVDNLTDDSKCYAFARPKIGVELFHHIRINASVTITERHATGWTLSVGFVFGGRPRK